MNQSCDVLVVGAGAAGLAASIEAASAGASCLVLEAFPREGGAAATAGGGCCVVGTPMQREADIEDSVELALDDWLAIGGADADAGWARYYLEHSLQDIYLWAESLGVRWRRLVRFEGNSVPRTHFPERGGAELIARLFERATRLGVRFSYSSRVSELTRSGASVTGAVVEGRDGRVTISARNVVMATGGFCNDQTRVRRLLGWEESDRLLCGGALQAKGFGHDVLERVGASFAFLDHIFIYATGTPDPDDPDEIRGLTVSTPPGGIVVNLGGQRIYDEGLVGFVSSARALLAERPRTSRLVFDARSARQLQIAEPNYRTGSVPHRDAIDEFLKKSLHVHRAPTLAELASQAGIDGDSLQKTVAEFNGWIESGVVRDPDFGRDLTPAAQLVEPPFFAIEFYPLARKSLGGVVTDMSCRVIADDGSVIRGLYAAGEVAGMAGGHINGSAGLEGTMVAPSMLSGRIAGRTAAVEALSKSRAHGGVSA